jgi:sulfur-oxidizing protein SoxY
MHNRRVALKQGAMMAGALAATNLYVGQAQAFDKVAFEAKGIANALKALGVTAQSESKDVCLTAPDIAENGAVVPMSVTTTLPNVKRLALLVDKNPNALTAMINVSDAIEPAFSTRGKMGQTSDVYAVAITADGKAFYAKKEIKVTLGGCGG